MRAVLSVVIAALAAAGAAVLATGALPTGEVRARLDVQALVLGRHVAEGLAPAFDDPAARWASLARAARELQLDLAIYDPSGQLVAEAGDPMPPPDPLAVSYAMTGVARTIADPWPPRVVAPIERDGQRRGLLVGRLTRMPARSPGAPSLLAAAAVLLVGLAAAFLLARGGSRSPAEAPETERAPGGEADKELLAIVGAEVRGALGRIRENAEALADRDDPMRHARIEGELVELDTLVEDALTTSRLGLDRWALRKRRTRLGVLVREAASSVASKNPLAFEVPAELPEVDVDARLCQKVVKILVLNAAQSSQPGATIGVRVEEIAGALRVSVTDGGAGIAPEDLPRVFEPFYRAKASKQQAPGGSGLGLTLARRIVEAHQGRIEVASEEGAGTTVSFTLPAAP